MEKKKISYLQEVILQLKENHLHRVFHKAVHFRFLQVRIFPVQVVLSLKVEVCDVLPPVLESIGAEFFHECIAETHRPQINPEGPEPRMIPEIFKVQIIPIRFDFRNQKAAVGRFSADPFPEGRTCDPLRPKCVRKQMGQISQIKGTAI